MSLAIEPRTVTSVMVGGTWYDVIGETFDIDAYEFVEGRPGSEDFHLLFFSEKGNPVGCDGFTFVVGTEGSGVIMSGPVSAIQAVKHTLQPLQ